MNTELLYKSHDIIHYTKYLIPHRDVIISLTFWSTINSVTWHITFKQLRCIRCIHIHANCKHNIHFTITVTLYEYSPYRLN